MSALRRFALATLATVTATTSAAAVAPSVATSAPPLEPDARNNAAQNDPARNSAVVPAIDTAQQASQAMQRMSLEDKIGQLFVLFTYGPDANKPDARNTAL